MTSTRSALDADWLGVCRRAVAGLEEILAEAPSTRERAEETGTRGSGGDRTLVIDRAAEAVVFEELDALHQIRATASASCPRSGARSTTATLGVVVIIDPIDGSLNAKRRISHYAISIAVADGPTMADVAFGFVYDFGPARGVVGPARRGRLAERHAARSRRCPSAAARDGRTRGARDRVGRPALGVGVDRRAGGERLPAARAGDDRLDRCARSRPPGSTGWSRCGAPAASTPPPAS